MKNRLTNALLLQRNFKTRMKAKVTNLNGNTAEVYLYGEIGRWMDVDTDVVVRDLERMRKEKGVRSVIFYVNSGGGDVMQGLALYNYLIRSGLDVTWVVDGIAASMMAMLMSNPKHKVKAAKYAKLMYHRVTGYVYGNSDEIRDAADMVDTFEADLVTMMAERTGLKPEDVRSTYFDGSDHWVSVADAVMIGLVDEILDGDGAMPDMPETFNTAHDAQMYYATFLINHLKNNIMPLNKELAKKLGLSDDASEEAVSTKISELQNSRDADAKTIADLRAENKRLADEAAQRKDADIEKMVQDAIDAKKIGTSQKDVFLNLAKKDFETTKAVLDGMKGVEPIAPQLKPETGKEDPRTWDELHKAGELEKIKSNNPERYNKLFEAKFGHSPKN